MLIIAALVVSFSVGATAIMNAAAFLISGPPNPIKRRKPNPDDPEKPE